MLRSVARTVTAPMVQRSSQQMCRSFASRRTFSLGICSAAFNSHTSTFQSMLSPRAFQKIAFHQKNCQSMSLLGRFSSFQQGRGIATSRLHTNEKTGPVQSLEQDPNYDPNDPHFTEERLVHAMYFVPSILGFVYLFYLWNPYRGEGGGCIDPPNFGVCAVMLTSFAAFGGYGASVFGAFSHLVVPYYFFMGMMVACTWLEHKVHQNVVVVKY